MEFKDYYDTLGVKPDTSAADIKSAYRKLARKYHPDRNKEADAEDRFKEINEAYEVLKDADKRRSYDEVRAGGYRGGDQFRPPPGWGSSGGAQGFDFGGGGFSGGADFSDFFESLFGQASAARGRHGGQSRQQRGGDIQAHVDVDLATAYNGGKRRFTLKDSAGTEKVLEVAIPAGILPGKTIRLGGQGQPGMGAGKAGDLLLEIGVLPDPRFQLDERNVLSILPIAPWEAALGAAIEVPTLGGAVQMRIPPGSQSGRKLRLKGRGMPGKTPGDQLVTLEVHVPEADTDEAKAAYEAMREAFPDYQVRS